jgi:Flp pilus assembly protein TadB
MSGPGLLVGVCLATGIVLGAAAWIGWTPATWSHPSRRRPVIGWNRVWRTLAVAMLVALVTRWPVAVAAAAALTWLWPHMFGGAREGRARLARLEAVATWTESLRDTMAAAVGLEQAIIASVGVGPDPIAPQLQRLAGRLRSHVPVPQSLAGFADELDDASVDLVVAALIMNSQLRGSGLVATLTALAGTARDELEMRTRVEEGRKNLRRNARIIIGVTLAFAGAVMLFSRDYLAPYGTVTGQLMLLLVVGVFAAGFTWIRRASRVDPPPRFLAGPAQIAELTGARS